MKKIIFSFGLLLATGATFAQVKKTLDIVTKATCDCIVKEKGTVKNQMDLQKVMSVCLMKTAGDKLPALQKELGIKTMDQAGMMKLGQAVSLKLATDCPTMYDIASKLQGGTDDVTANEPAVTTESYTGEILKVETDGYTYIQIKNNDGKITKFVWFEYFKGSDAYKENPQLLVGKRVTIKYKAVEIFVPASKDYVSSKEITELSAN